MDANQTGPRPHIPDLEKLSTLGDVELQFYGLVGALTSVVAGLEHRSFRIFQAAKGLNEKAATAEFYQKREFAAARRKRANEAMKAFLLGKAVKKWDALFERWTDATGEGAPRHLVSHNQVQAEEKDVGGIFDRALFDSKIFDTGHVELGLVIKQDDFQVMANLRTANKADVADLLANCQEVAEVLKDIDAFLEEVQSSDTSSNTAG